MRLVLAIAAVAFLLDDNAEPFYKFKAGTFWTFEATKKPAKGPKMSKLEFKVVKEEEGKIELESKAHRDGSEPQVESLRWAVKDGILTWSEIRSGEEKTTMQLYKLGSKKGDTWEWAITEGGKAKSTHLGREEVKVAAGTYKDALHVQFEMVDGPVKFTMEIYFAAGVGPVKVIGGSTDEDRTTLELKEFKIEK